ncbi:MAG: helix-turn-helix transcriptional regulator, partial [Caldilineaceae bacterium]
MQSFSDLLKRYTERTGISDAELARAVGVRRQTIFRWKEGSVARPRSRDDVLAVGEKLRLAPAEIDELLLAAGFPPQQNLPHTRPATAIDKIDEADLPPVHRAQSSPPEGGQNERGQTNGERAATATAGDTLSPNRLAGRSKLLGWGISILVLLALLAVVWVARREPLPVAAPGETLVIVGQFTNFTQGEIGFNVAGRIAEPLRKEIERAALTSVRVVTWPDPIRSEAEAQAVLTRSRAWMAIWGEYDSGRVLVRFAQADSATAPPEVESLVASPDELFATINSEIPQEIRYLALLTLGAYYAGDN